MLILFHNSNRMEQDKLGNVSMTPTKCIAQPDSTEEGTVTREETSRRGVGHGWKNINNTPPSLFGSGGHRDGATAMIQTFANRQVEDEAALHGNGDDSIDSNRYHRNQSNANTEFSFTQYKSGALHSQRGKVLPGEGMMTIGSTDGLYSGDTMIRVDPYSDMIDMTVQAVGAVLGNVYKDDDTNTQSFGPKVGKNPFKGGKTSAQKRSDEDKVSADMHGPTTQQEDEEDGFDIDYYFDDTYYEGEKAEKAVKKEYDSGLRRINTKTSQQRQLNQVATKEQIMSAYQSANDQYAQVLQDHMGGAYLDQEGKVDLLEKLRPENSKYQASQVGVNDLSRSRSKAYKGTRHNRGTTKLNAMLVGV